MTKYAEQKAAYYQANIERIKAQRKQFYEDNKERLRAKALAWHAKNPDYQKRYAEENKDRALEWARSWRLSYPEKAGARHERWRVKNPAIMNAHSSARRARVISAIPSWYDEFLVSEIYALATLRTKVTGTEWHVDHIVPLKSKLVCGLHCAENMRVVTARENLSKNNLYWPDMP